MKITTKFTLGAIATTIAIVGGIIYFTPPAEEMLTGDIKIPVEIPKQIIDSVGLTLEEIDLLDYEVKQIDTIHPTKSLTKNELWNLVIEKVKKRVVKVGLKSLEISEYKTKRAILLNKL